MAHRIHRSALAAMLLIGIAIARSASAGHTQLPIEAIWRIQKLHFHFYSSTTTYACDSLERKVANILKAVGARADVAADTGCFGNQFVRGGVVQVTLASAVPATPENVRRETSYDGRDELIARLRKAPLPTTADIERFPAAWQRVSLVRDRRARIERADCDLIVAMSKEVFPKIAVELDTRTFSCPISMTRIRPLVDVTALLPAKSIPLAAARAANAHLTPVVRSDDRNEADAPTLL